MNNINIGKLLEIVRISTDMPVKDLCKGVCAPTTYNRYERGELTPEELADGICDVTVLASFTRIL